MAATSLTLPSLAGRRVVVTGSTRGIGLGIARTLIGQGAKVVINSRRQEDADRVAESLGDGAFAVAGELADAASAAALVDTAAEKMGGLDALVNNAGIGLAKPSVDIAESDWRGVMDLNLNAAFFCAQAAGRRLLESGGGVIVNIASLSAFTGQPARVAYATSKAGVVGMTRVLAVEWSPTVRVVGVAPGYVLTEMIQKLADDGAIDTAALNDRTPTNRMAEPDEIGEITAFLLSDSARQITGQTILVDGGLSLNAVGDKHHSATA